jgi:hypothetical protein
MAPRGDPFLGAVTPERPGSVSPLAQRNAVGDRDGVVAPMNPYVGLCLPAVRRSVRASGWNR